MTLQHAEARLDVAVSDLYQSPGPLWYSTWQIAVLFGVNDSTMRRQIERGNFPGAVKNYEGEWVVPALGVAKRLLKLVSAAHDDMLHQPPPEKTITQHVPPGKREPVTYALYRWYDGDDLLLYIGQSKNAPRRTKQHEQDKEWWEQVARSTVEHHPTRAAVSDAEAEAIRRERPRYNKVRYV